MLDKRNFYINGRWVAPLQTNDFEVINPSNEESCAIISLGSAADTDSAVKSSKRGFYKLESSFKRRKNFSYRKVI